MKFILIVLITGMVLFMSKNIFAADEKVKTQKAAFALGCFWGAQAQFDKVKGVVSTTVGYMGGDFKDPTYEDMHTEKTGHAETVLVEFDPSQVTYEELLNVFWEIHDPTTLNRQGPDEGPQYRSAIFCFTPEQLAAAKASKETLDKSGLYQHSITTEIASAKTFYRAEEYHQGYLKKTGGICHILFNGRKKR